MAARKSKPAKTELASQTDPRAPLAFDAFLSSAQKVLKALAEDLLKRADDSSAVTAALTARWEAEKAAKRTADVYEVYRRRTVGQVAAAWLLSVVFVRTLEDRGLVERNRIAGAGASDSQKQFVELAPYLTERDYLLTVFRELSNLEAAKDLFDPKHDLLWKLAPSAGGAKALLELFRAPNTDAPTFRFGQSDTRFLGDLYQLLDEDVRERFALLQTPRFVESFILDRTLERSVQEFGIDATTMIDPTCGSGHFLLGAFERLFDHQLRQHPSLDARKAVEKALDAVHGVDLNPYAVAIARFRLTLTALEKAGWTKIEAAPRLPLNLVVADSLLHRTLAGQVSLGDVAGQSARTWQGEEFALEDETGAKRVLGMRFAVVVGNPPYITVKDAALRETYRAIYPRSAAGKYSLGAPFTERFFDLARERGFVGMITANSFMKREFGKRLIEDYLRSVKLELIANTSGAYIPGHGTPTVLLFGRNERPGGGKVLGVLAKRGEPSTPDDPEQGVVWRSVADHLGELGFENDYVSVVELERAAIEKHPWSLGGGGAAELKEVLDETAHTMLGQVVSAVGVFGMSNADDCMWGAPELWERLRVEPSYVRQLVIGEDIRDWSLATPLSAVFPYDPPARLVDIQQTPRLRRHLWPFRTVLGNRATFGGGTYLSDGLAWWKWHQVTEDRVEGPAIAFAFVATHNHFVLDRGGKVFNRSAPIIKLPKTATEDDHLALLGYLNSSTACFWMKQVFFPKATGTNVGDVRGQEHRLAYEFAGTGLNKLPLPDGLNHVLALARALDSLARERTAKSPELVLSAETWTNEASLRQSLHEASVADAATHVAMVYAQEELDWLVYGLFGLCPSQLAAQHPANGFQPRPTDRPFCVDGTRLTSLPAHWLARRDHLQTAESQWLRLLETPLNKRPWFGRQGVFHRDEWTYGERLGVAIDHFIVSEIEAGIAHETGCLTLAQIHTLVSNGRLRAAVELRTQDARVTAQALVENALRGASVPFLPALRLTASGLDKRAAWNRTWDAQRAEDAGPIDQSQPDVGVPPKYDVKDFVDQNYWRLRGKLDVPTERFISYCGCESDEDGSPVYGWAGWDHLQQAQALAALYQKRKTEEGWGKDRLVPMLAGLDELVPWVLQWHNEPNEAFGGQRLGDYFRDFVAGECQVLGLTLEDVRAWRPEPKRGKGRKKKGEEGES